MRMRSRSENVNRFLVSIVLAAWIVVIVACVSPLIDPRVDLLSTEFVLYCVLIFTTFYISLFVSASMSISNLRMTSAERLRQVMFTLLSLGVAARGIDRIFLRPVGDILSIAAVRDARLAESNLVSIVGAVAPAFGVALFAILQSRHLSHREITLARLIACVYLADLFLTGSRGILIFALILVFGIRISVRSLLFFVPALIVASGGLYVYRFLALTAGSDASQILLNSSRDGYAYFVPASQTSLQLLQTDFGEWLFFPLLQTNQYAAHGLFEFAYLMNNAPAFTFAPGQLVPQIPFLAPQSELFFRENLYYTLPGTLVLSFGVVGALLAAAVIGACLGRVCRHVAQVGGAGKTVVGIVIFGVPFVNTIGGFDLIFYLTAIWLFARYEIVDTRPKIPEVHSLSGKLMLPRQSSRDVPYRGRGLA